MDNSTKNKVGGEMTTIGAFKIVVDDEKQLLNILQEASRSISQRQQFLNFTSKNHLEIDNVEFSRTSENEAEFRIKISDDLLIEKNGSIVWLFGLLFGNTFRHDSIIEFRLIKIDFSPSMYYKYRGPVFGLTKIKEDFNMEFPIISCPLPPLSPEPWKDLIEILISSNIRFIVEGPIGYLPNKVQLEQRIKFLDEIAKQQDFTVVYFINVTVQYEEIMKWIKNIISISQTNNVKIGLRVCPLSTGLGILPSLRNLGYPLMAYTLLDRIYCENKNFGMSGSCLSSTLRILGADVVNAGLLVSRDIKNFHVYEVIQELKRNINLKKMLIKKSVPLLTGGLKPRDISTLGKIFGNEIVYHAGSGILKGYPNLITVEQNCKAYNEATIIAKENLEHNDVLENNEKRFRNYITYTRRGKKREVK